MENILLRKMTLSMITTKAFITESMRQSKVMINVYQSFFLIAVLLNYGREIQTIIFKKNYYNFLILRVEIVSENKESQVTT